MKLEKLAFGSIQIDGVVYETDIIIDSGEIRKRKKKPSKKFRGRYGHTPLSLAENIPWNCRRLVIGTGMVGALPVMDEVKREAKRRQVELRILQTEEAIEALKEASGKTNAVLHITC